MATVNVNNWDEKNTATTQDLSDSTSVSNLQKVLVIKASEGTGSGTGDVQFSSSTWSNISDASDIVVTESDESTTKAYEIEDLDTTNNEATIHVYGPWNSGSTEMVVAAGTGDGTDYSSGGTGANPWQSNAKGVWHLNDLLDSTSNNNDLTNTGATSTTGVIDGAYSFDGTDDYLYNTSPSNIPEGLSGEKIVVNYWTNIESFDADNEAGQIAFHDDYEGGAGEGWFARIENSGEIFFRIFGDNNGGTGNLSTNTDYLITIVWDVGTDIQVFLDGTSIQTVSTTDTSDATSPELSIGQQGTNSGSDNSFLDGLLDEVRIYEDSSANNIDSNWVQAEYDASPKGGQTFFSWSGPETTASFNGITTTADATGTGGTTSLSGDTAMQTTTADATGSGDTIFIEPDFAALTANGNGSGETISISGQTTVMVAETANANASGVNNLNLNPNLLLGQGASASATGATISTDRLKGNVDVDGQPTAGVDVNVVDKTNNILYETTTDSNGDWIVDSGNGIKYQVAYLFDDGSTFYGDAEESDTT